MAASAVQPARAALLEQTLLGPRVRGLAPASLADPSHNGFLCEVRHACPCSLDGCMASLHRGTEQLPFFLFSSGEGTQTPPPPGWCHLCSQKCVL